MFLSVASCQNNQQAVALTEAELAAQHLQQLYDEQAQDARQRLGQLVSNHADSATVDFQAARYYNNGGQWIWMGKPGQIEKCDTLMSILTHQVDSMGFSPAYFLLPDIQPLLAQMHQPDSVQEMASTMAQLEWNLTRAYLLYSKGQRFGFTNPVKLFGKNNYDTQIEQADTAFYAQAFREASAVASLADFLIKSEPQDDAYKRLKTQLAIDSTDTDRQRTLCNMERRRWRNTKPVPENGRYIFVNVAAQEVWAIGGDSVINMRICCGKASTKSPLLTSQIEKIEVNPEWGIPQSIIRGEVSNRAGDSAYFARHRYYITDGSGRRVNPSSVTSSQLRSGRYAVRQYSGAGNALGRIIFRFPNRFSVYLHDTSSPSAFSKAQRTVSHGCIRLQRPFEIAEFVLPQADPWLLDQMRLSMDMQPKTDQGREYKRTHRGAIRLVKSTPVEPSIPVYIDYYTLFPNPKTGKMDKWGDPYSYDKLILNGIKPYLP